MADEEPNPETVRGQHPGTAPGVQGLPAPPQAESRENRERDLELHRRAHADPGRLHLEQGGTEESLRRNEDGARGPKGSSFLLHVTLPEGLFLTVINQQILPGKSLILKNNIKSLYYLSLK